MRFGRSDGTVAARRPVSAFNEHAYPVTFKTYASGRIGAFFVDVPEAITAGASEAEALDRAHDALVMALSAYLDDGRALPVPSKAKRAQPVVAVPPRVAIKLAIHEAMREQAMTQAQRTSRHRRAASATHSRP